MAVNQSAHINVMIKAARKAARRLVRDFGEVENLQVSRKGPGDFVSLADQRAEDTIREVLTDARPAYALRMEESGDAGDQAAEFRWVVDPLDGTTNFLHGLPHWCISIGLEHNGRLVAGVIFDPIKDELFWGEKGQGAYVNDKRLRVSGRRDLADSLLVTGLPELGRPHQDETMADLVRIMPRCGVRRTGSAALDLAYVAAGRYDGYWERGLSAWDIAAGIVIAREAGAIITEINGAGEMMRTGSILAGTPDIHDTVRKLLKQDRKAKGLRVFGGSV